MALHYSKVYGPFVLAGADTIELDVPSRTDITRLIITDLVAGAYNATVYNKQLTRDDLDIQSIIEDPEGSGDTLIILDDPTTNPGGPPIQVAVGEVLTVASSGVGGYDTDHIVVAVNADGTILTDQTYTADAASGTGTATATVPTVDYPLYEVFPLTAATGGVVRHNDGTDRTFFNHDVDQLLGNTRKLYILISAAGTYKVAVDALSDLH